MSFDAMLWALKDAPTIDIEESMILQVMAEAAESDGRNAYKSQPTLARLSKCSDRTVRRRLVTLEQRGLIARGDQSVVMHLAADTRPVVWDLQIPYSWFSNIERINADRRDLGLKPLTPADRPDLGSPPAKKKRVDVGVSKPKKPKIIIETTGGLEDRPFNSENSDGNSAGLEVRPVSESKGAGLEDRPGPDLKSANPVLDPVLDSVLPLVAAVDGNDEQEEEEVAPEQLNQQLAEDVLDRALSKIPKSRHPQGRKRSGLTARIAALLGEGHQADALVSAMAGRIGPDDSPYALLDYRLTHNVGAPLPAASVPAQTSGPCPNQCMQGMITVASRHDRFRESEIPAQCPHCRPRAFQAQCADGRAKGVNITSLADLVAHLQDRLDRQPVTV